MLQNIEAEQRRNFYDEEEFFKTLSSGCLGRLSLVGVSTTASAVTYTANPAPYPIIDE